VPALTRTLVRAYMDDPVAVWMCRPDGLRARLLASLYAARLQQLLGHGGVWTDGGRASVSVWLPPGVEQVGVRPSLALARCVLDPRVAARLPLFAEGQRRMRRAHPKEPSHWYLSLLATDPDARGQGLGSAMLGPALERCDATGVGAYLESSKPRNLRFYARLGFEARGELKLPGGPTLWPMWRAAQTG
jgi:GNAT superfamily N-acetyltransferase